MTDQGRAGEENTDVLQDELVEMLTNNVGRVHFRGEETNCTLFTRVTTQTTLQWKAQETVS